MYIHVGSQFLLHTRIHRGIYMLTKILSLLTCSYQPSLLNRWDYTHIFPKDHTPSLYFRPLE